ncbi:MAG: Ferric uptake regulation protein [Herbinix sp.]|nr:Ferric uptake regulation protein [Herbinix sp.]
MHQSNKPENHPDNHLFITTVHKKDLILSELRRRGYKITNQRELIIDIILKNKFSSCKEIYYQVVMKDSSIGIATIYRMVKMLEELGIIDRKKLFQISYDNLIGILSDQIILIDEEKATELVAGDWYTALKQTLKANGFIGNHEISVIIKKTNPIEMEGIRND